MTTVTVRVLLNTCGDPARRLFDGYRAGDVLHEAITYTIHPDSPLTLDVARAICEVAYRNFNMDIDLLTGRGRALARTYRAGGHRPIQKGDVVIVGDIAMACGRTQFDPVTVAGSQIRAA